MPCWRSSSSSSFSDLILVSGLVAAGLGIVPGVVAGYLGGWVDRAVGTVTDAMLAFLFLILILRSDSRERARCRRAGHRPWGRGGLPRWMGGPCGRDGDRCHAGVPLPHPHSQI